MPIYEYECKICHHQFDLIQKMSEEPVMECPKCFQQSVVRMVSAAGFQLKGNGWYQTDFKDKPKSKSKPESASDVSSTSSDKPKQTTEKKGDKN